MKTFRMIGMALLAVLMCVNFASCSSDDDSTENPEKNEYGLPTNIAKNTIIYKTSDNIIIRFENEDVFGGARIVSNTYSTTNGYGTITFSSEVTAIEEAFSYNFKGNLIAIVLPASVASIGDEAFYYCKSLTSVTIPNSVTSIGNYAFSGCTELTSITIGNSVTSIGNSAFEGTAWFDNQLDGVVYVGKVLYKYKGEMPSSTYIQIKDGTTGISGNAFSGCSGLRSITIPNSVTSIGNYAFYGCSGLKRITIPNSVTSIGDYAFSGCTGLRSITIPNSVTSIGDYAFYGCSGLEHVYVETSTPPSINYSTFNNSYFYDFTTATLYVPKGSLAAYGAAEGWKYFRNIIEY